MFKGIAHVYVRAHVLEHLSQPYLGPAHYGSTELVFQARRVSPTPE